MADAVLIEIGGVTAGIAVKDVAGFRFFASDQVFYSLDGMQFDTIVQIQAAARGARISGEPRAMKQLSTAA